MPYMFSLIYLSLGNNEIDAILTIHSSQTRKLKHKVNRLARVTQLVRGRAKHLDPGTPASESLGLTSVFMLRELSCWLPALSFLASGIKKHSANYLGAHREGGFDKSLY